MWGAECDKAQETWYDRRRRHELDEANVQTDMWYNVCREQPPSIGDPKKFQIDFGFFGPTIVWMAEEMALFRQTVQALATAGYVFSRIDVNAWSTVAQGLQARDDDGTMITSIADRESQCC